MSIVPPHVVKYFESVCKKSLIFDEECESNLPKFDFIELLPGRILGRGGFCNVNEMSKITLSVVVSDDKEEINNSEYRSHMANNCVRDGDARYAIKRLRKDLDKEDILKGIFDLALEAKFLTVIDHPHIIKIRGVASAECLSTDYFVILDRLYNTLYKQMTLWDEKKRKLNNAMAKLCDLKGKKKKNLMVEKLNVFYDIAAAVNYLHENRIIYRDLSPDNIGFDVRNQVKIFDFGLAKELLPSLKLNDGTYKLTGYTGSLRYMAPEVVLCKSYNESADVFSFGILLWQMLACATPYDGFTVPMYERIVVGNGDRPIIKPNWPTDLSELMISCWSANPSERPQLDYVMVNVKTFILSQKFGKQIEFDLDMSRRSNENESSK